MASILDLARMHDSGNLAGAVSEIATVTGPNSMLVTAVRTGAGRLRLISWQANSAGPVTRLGDSGNLAGVASQIDITRGGAARYVTACRDNSGRLKLIGWDLDATGAFFTRVSDSGTLAGAASRIRIVSLSNTLFVTACRTGSGILRLISWQLDAAGTISRLGDSGNSAGAVQEIALCRLTGDRVVTAVRTSGGNVRVIAWSVSAAGAVARLGDSGDQAGAATLIRAVAVSRDTAVTSVRDADGDLKLISWRINADGQVARLNDSGGQAGDIGDNALIALPDGVVSAVRTGDGILRLIAWQLDAAGAITRRGDSASQAGTSFLVGLQPGPDVVDAAGHSVSMVAAVRTASGNLRLITWGPAVVRLHFKILTAPAVTPANMLNAMQTVYRTVGINVVNASTENLNLPLLNNVDVGSCTMGDTTEEQERLFANRNNVGDNDVAVYFVQATNPPLNGCAAHPSGRPSAVVAQGATQWTMGHEVGHVLGLNHVNNSDRLMTGGGTAGITLPPPDLVASEQATMIQSPYSVPV